MECQTECQHMSDSMQDRLSEFFPDRMATNMSNRMPKRTLEYMSNRMTENMPNRISQINAG